MVTNKYIKKKKLMLNDKNAFRNIEMVNVTPYYRI